MTFLTEIRAYKEELLREKTVSMDIIREKALSMDRRPDFFKYRIMRDGLSLIAEIKLASPSEGQITGAGVEDLAGLYQRSGADCISVLTEDKYFAGNLENINRAKTVFSGPVLMKDFIISDYQIYEGALNGADAVLIIAAMHDENSIQNLLNICSVLGLSALVEIHDSEELELIKGLNGIQMIGVNCRDLKSLKLNRKKHIDIAPLLPDSMLKIAESGIHSTEDAKRVWKAGYDAVLVGTSIIRSSDPAGLIQGIMSVS